MAEAQESFLDSLLTYHSVKLIAVKNKKLGAIYWTVYVAVVLYVVVTAVILEKGYQQYDVLTGASMLKVKGTARTGDLSDPSSIYVYDAYDLVMPGLQPEAIFITTNFVYTSNQTREKCSGNNDNQEKCNCSNYDSVELCCQYGAMTDNGMKLGYCSSNGVYCEIQAWCPLEDPNPDLQSNILEDVRNWTLFTRVSAFFSQFNQTISNTDTSLEPDENLWYVEDMLEQADTTFDDVKELGCILVGTWSYDCDFNYDPQLCQPTITWNLIPQSNESISKGFNYRWVSYRTDAADTVAPMQRDLFKYYGIQIYVQETGRAGRFSLPVLLITLGAGLALTSVATLATDFFMQYLMRNKERYVKAKNQSVQDKEDLERSLMERYSNYAEANGEYLISEANSKVESDPL